MLTFGKAYSKIERKPEDAEEVGMEDKQRIIQELVPGKQVTLAHIIANPDPALYVKLGFTEETPKSGTAVGVLTVTPAETAIIMADLAVKSAGITLEFVDRISGSLIITGSVSSVEASVNAILAYCEGTLRYETVPVTRT